MLKRLRKAHPILFCVLAEVVFLASLFVTDLVFTIALVLFGRILRPLIHTSTALCRSWWGPWWQCCFWYGQTVLGCCAAAAAAFSMACWWACTRWCSLATMPLVRWCWAGRRTACCSLRHGICTFLVSMAMVGVAEEFIFRGVIAQTLLEHFGTSRAGVWKACLLSGVLFGAAHLTNILSSAPFGVLMQCVFAASLGTLFAAIYFRTGNLWVTVFLHGAMDISSMLIGGLYGTTTVADAVSGYDASMLLSVLLYLIPTAVLLRKKKLPEVQLYWHQYVKK